MGRKLKGLTKRILIAARIEQHLVEMIKDEYGSIQKFIDRVVREKIIERKGVEKDTEEDLGGLFD